MRLILLGCWLALAGAGTAAGQSLLVEAESFSDPGGWKLDTQFVREMNSPYLLAHGLGQPVSDATTTVKFPKVGVYRVRVRTKDWVARWNGTGHPGKFQLLIDGKAVATTFGTEGQGWGWQDGGLIEISNREAKLALHDLTGFDGRCDAILFTADPEFQPPRVQEAFPRWRRTMLGVSAEIVDRGPYDLVVVGGGYAGMGASISAARMGCRVALIQDRSVLGGNGSSEVRVWAKGNIQRGRFPRLGEIVNEFSDQATKSPGAAEEFGDDLKASVVAAEPNIELFLNHHGFAVEKTADAIASVLAFDTRTSEIKRFSGARFVDCTGHGTLGYLAGAEFEMTPQGRMGMSNMWTWDDGDHATSFPQTPWALDLEMADFPYPRDHHGQWFWESGFDKDPLLDAEGIRDWNLRAVYGAFNAMKNRDGADQHRNASLTWVAYVGGPRESRRLLGDVVLTEADIVGKRDFPDGTVPSTWSIDLHYPKEQYAKKYSDNPFISKAVHGEGVDRNYGYPIPYRCFYSKNVPNLFMAGRCVSVTHQALGTVRVMKTCGMMGEVVGKAAAICTQRDCTPRQVHDEHLDELLDLLKLPAGARRATLEAEWVIPETPIAESTPSSGIAMDSLPGLVIDDADTERTGDWRFGDGLTGFIGAGYQYAPASKATMTFKLTAPGDGAFEVRLAFRPHENRTRNARVRVSVAQQPAASHAVDMTQAPALDQPFVSLGRVQVRKGQVVEVQLSGDPDDSALLCGDAAQLLPVDQ